MYNKIFIFLVPLLFAISIDICAQTQAEMNQTAITDYKKADAELNKVYKQLMKKLEPKEKQLLINAQKDWLKFRDSDCKFESGEYGGGSISPLIYSSCLTDRTNARIEDLKASLEE